ncbi:Ctr copper transporter family-domain-containing protein [Xylariales sp. PMI_506]|nr:Ctr copper transporter family-domain-containing protein [Xylariales sp. PMI_506]
MAAAMATATSMADMMDDSTTTTMTSEDMSMVFFTGFTTPLFSTGWTPTTQGAYAGTCIFLVALCVIHRVLQAVKSAVFPMAGHGSGSGRALPGDGDSDIEKSAPARVRAEWNGHPFSVATETCRAVVEVITGGIGYLLMLAVMTMNVGYFLSVLGGIFLGTFVAGRFSTYDSH